MAAGKKSFVLYTDLVHSVEILNDEQAGKLFKHILNYVNDFDPNETDPFVRLAFEPIKQQLKRDLKAWKTKRKKRSDAGRIGGIKSGIARSKTKQNEANEAVTVNDTVNVTVNDTVILYRIEECLQIALNDDRWTKANKTNREELEIFNGYLEQVSEYTKNPMDYKSHFARFKRKYPDKVKPDSKPMSIEEFRRLAKEQDKISA